MTFGVLPGWNRNGLKNSHCYIDEAFFLVVQYPIGDLHAKFQLDGGFCLGIGKILTNSTGLIDASYNVQSSLGTKTYKGRQ